MTYTITDDGQRNYPKYVEFYSKNECEKLVHLVGFITRIYHDARSPVRQMNRCFSVKPWRDERLLVRSV